MAANCQRATEFAPIAYYRGGIADTALVLGVGIGLGAAGSFDCEFDFFAATQCGGGDIDRLFLDLQCHDATRGGKCHEREHAQNERDDEDEFVLYNVLRVIKS